MADIKQQMQDALGKLQENTTEYAELGGMAVHVGLPSDRIHEPSGLPLAELGAIHEFGQGNIPERSFLRSLPVLKGAKIKKALQVQAKKAADGTDPKILMEQTALFGQSLVQENIVELKNPALANPRKDGSSNPLVDTGALRQGVIGVVVDD